MRIFSFVLATLLTYQVYGAPATTNAPTATASPFAAMNPPIPKRIAVKPKVMAYMPIQQVVISWQTNVAAEYYVLMGSTDLKKWNPIATYTNTNFAVYSFTNGPLMFFKVFGQANFHPWVTLGFTFVDDQTVDYFVLYNGIQSQQYNNSNVIPRMDFTTNFYVQTVSNLVPATSYFFRAKAFTVDNISSDYDTNEVAYVTPAPSTTYYQQMPTRISTTTAVAAITKAAIKPALSVLDKTVKKP